jgi:hypothetical protein
MFFVSDYPGSLNLPELMLSVIVLKIKFAVPTSILVR